jgi:hypothetical protein
MVIAGLVVASACAGPRNTLGTAASACFRALPSAKDAVHRKGKLVGVRRVDTDSLQRRIPNDPTLATLPDRQLCVFAFKGSFRPGDVPQATNRSQGPYAIVALTSQHPKVVAAFVLTRLPTRFRHLS